MEIFKDGKYIIGFLVGVICSFIIMGGIENYKNPDNGDISGTGIVGEEQTLGDKDGNVTTNITNGQKVTKPEDPHSPELQRLALILRETERMVERLKQEMASLGEGQQTAGLLSQN